MQGSNSTFANTDTSGATTLRASSNAVDRDQESTYTSQGPSSSSGNVSAAGAAPSYVNNQFNVDGKAKGGPESDFSSGMKNASFDTDIGGRNDPGRAATEKFAVNASATSSGLAALPKQEGASQDNAYETLSRDEDA